MMRTEMKIIMLAASAMLAGCNVPTPGTPRDMGAVDYTSAFATSREVLAQYYPIAMADPETGVIESRPQDVKASSARLLGGTSPTREVARMYVREKNGRVVVNAAVMVQQNGAYIRSTSPRPEDNYSSVPDQTPAEGTAATTPEQNDDWQTLRFDKAAERKMLQQIYQHLHPEGEREE